MRNNLPDLIHVRRNFILSLIVKHQTTENTSDASLERLRVALHVWHRLLSGRFTKDRKKELRPKLPKVCF